jgi:sugar lactone lactonase YvrE
MKNLSFGLVFLLVSALPVLTNAQIVTTIAGNGTAGYTGDGGMATACELDAPSFIAFGVLGGFGVLYVDDAYNNRMRQIKIGGIIRCVAGNGTAGYSGDGGQATAAELNNPGGMTTDKHGNVYFAELNNGVVRKFNNLGIIKTIGGDGGTSFYGDGGLATNASFNTPHNVAIDTIGNVFVCDQWNHCIRKIDTAGYISTVAGTPMTSGFSGDGGAATDAKLSYPNYVRTDTLGNLFITDNGNQRIRKVTPDGVIHTIAGNGSVGYSGDGGPATLASLNYPGGIEMDSYGNIYIGDAYNNRVRCISGGTIFTIGGTGAVGYTGDGGPATAATFNKPSDIAVDNYNNIYVNDWFNNVIRKISAVFPLGLNLIDKGVATLDMKIAPNPTSISADISWNNFEAGLGSIVVYDMSGREVYHSEAKLMPKEGNTQINVSEYIKGLYWVRLSIGEQISTQSMVVEK